LEKSEYGDTCTVYDVAPDEAYQYTLNDVVVPLAPFVGEPSVGCTGCDGTVVNDLVSLEAIVPLEFVAITDQEYVVEYPSTGVVYHVFVVVAEPEPTEPDHCTV
jgi:hypothetical protein